MFFRRVAPRRLAGSEPLFHEALRFAEQNRNVLDRVQTVADEKRNDDAVFCLRQPMAVFNERRFLHENRMDIGVNFLRTDQFHLPLDGLARILVSFRSMSGDEKRGFGWLWRAR